MLVRAIWSMLNWNATWRRTHQSAVHSPSFRVRKPSEPIMCNFMQVSRLERAPVLQESHFRLVARLFLHCRRTSCASLQNRPSSSSCKMTHYWNTGQCTHSRVQLVGSATAAGVSFPVPRGLQAHFDAFPVTLAPWPSFGETTHWRTVGYLHQ